MTKDTKAIEAQRQAWAAASTANTLSPVDRALGVAAFHDEDFMKIDPYNAMGKEQLRLSNQQTFRHLTIEELTFSDVRLIVPDDEASDLSGGRRWAFEQSHFRTKMKRTRRGKTETIRTSGDLVIVWSNRGSEWLMDRYVLLD